MQKSKKGFAGQAITLIMFGIVAAVLLGAGIYAVVSFRDKLTANSVEFNATNDMIDQLADTPTWIGLLIVIGFVVLIIGALIGGFALGKGGKGGM